MLVVNHKPEDRDSGTIDESPKEEQQPLFAAHLHPNSDAGYDTANENSLLPPDSVHDQAST